MLSDARELWRNVHVVGASFPTVVTTNEVTSDCYGVNSVSRKAKTKQAAQPSKTKHATLCIS